MPPKQQRVLGWTPQMSFEELVISMVTSDIEIERRKLK